MICPSCGYDNIEGTDRCDECLTPFRSLDVPRSDDSQGLARSVMEDNLSQIEQEFLAVASNTPVKDVIAQMQQSRLGCALVIDDGTLTGIFTERDVLNKLTGKEAMNQTAPVSHFMSPDPEVLRESDSVATAVNKMSMGPYRHIPVRRADGSYSVTSIKHVLKYIAREEW